MGKCIREYLPEAQTVKPDGAFYYLVDMRRYLDAMDHDEEELCNRLLYRKSVVGIPGRFFGENGAGHIRLTFVSEPEDRIEMGMRRIGEYVFSFAFSVAAE